MSGPIALLQGSRASDRGLTRRCSGLATLAAELHFVRRCLNDAADTVLCAHRFFPAISFVPAALSGSLLLGLLPGPMEVNTSSVYLPTSPQPPWQASPGSCLVLVVPHCVTGPHCPTVGCRNASPSGVPRARARTGHGSMRRSARPPSGSPTPPNPSLQRTGRSRFWDSFSHSVSFRLFGFVARRPAAEHHIVRRR